jgi:thiol-disulfide isomerase/thioredoxin
MKFKKKYGFIGISFALIIILSAFLNSATEIEAASWIKTLIFDHKTARLFRDAGVREVFRFALPDDVSLLDLNGENVNISDIKGKVAFIHFWTTWNTDCQVEMPAMEKLYKRFKHKDFYMAAVNLKEPASRVKQFFNNHRFTFAALLDAKGKIGDRFAIRATPFTIILDKNGRVIGKAQGFRDWDSKPATALFEYLVN